MKSNRIIGRKEEQRSFELALNSPESEFIAVYGRRRVGKTYLVRNFFQNRGFFFELTGEKGAPLAEQLSNFAKQMEKASGSSLPLKTPVSWKEAFSQLSKMIQTIDAGKRIIIFLDELPWLASRRSGIAQALDYFWNSEWSKMNNIVLIVCGSAASWMLDKVVNARGGLHNRLTRIVKLAPFTLQETREYFLHRGIRLNNMQILELYMVMGGIPYYLKAVEKGKSAEQIIQQVCFTPQGILNQEYDKLFASLFNHSEIHEQIVEHVGERRKGISRGKLIEVLGATSGGRLNARLKELEASGFIERYVPYGKASRDQLIRLVDEFVIFALKWMRPIRNKGAILRNPNYWATCARTPAWNAWAGYTFEAVCMKHISRIIEGLNLSNVAGEVSHWYAASKAGSRDGAQIDLLVDRSDNAISICEIKWSNKPFVIDKSYFKDLLRKIDVFENQAARGKQVFLSFITTSGLKENVYSEELVSSHVTLDQLF